MFRPLLFNSNINLLSNKLREYYRNSTQESIQTLVNNYDIYQLNKKFILNPSNNLNNDPPNNNSYPFYSFFFILCIPTMFFYFNTKNKTIEN